MVYYIIRHKSTGQIMPLMKRNRGYSHWNPSNKENPSYKIYSELKVPRILESLQSAKKVINGWKDYPNGKNSPMYDRESGYTEFDLHFKDDGRNKEDLEIVKVTLSMHRKK